MPLEEISRIILGRCGRCGHSGLRYDFRSNVLNFFITGYGIRCEFISSIPCIKLPFYFCVIKFVRYYQVRKS